MFLISSKFRINRKIVRFIFQQRENITTSALKIEAERRLAGSAHFKVRIGVDIEVAAATGERVATVAAERVVANWLGRLTRRGHGQALVDVDAGSSDVLVASVADAVAVASCINAARAVDAAVVNAGVGRWRWRVEIAAFLLSKNGGGD